MPWLHVISLGFDESEVANEWGKGSSVLPTSVTSWLHEKALILNIHTNTTFEREKAYHKSTSTASLC